MFQKALQAIVEFLCNFVIGHPRIVSSIVGVLAAAAMIAAVVAMNLLNGG